MSVNAEIFCFSGTGNTSYIARQLSELLGCNVHNFTAEELKHPSKCVIDSKADVAIWAFPTYSWGVPPIIKGIIEKGSLQFPDNSIHIAVTSAGDDVGNLPRMFRRHIKKRNLVPGAVFSVQMPNTYVMMKGFDTDSEEVARLKVLRSVSVVKGIAEKILNKELSPKDDIIVKGRFAWFKTAIIYPWFVRNEMSPDGFHVDSNICIKCGRCGEACPMDNITYNNEGAPVWGENCAFCTACYHICPVHAINWEKATLNKRQVKIFSSKR